jgi:hypothetical protein
MTRRVGVVCAAALLLAAAGCSLNSFLVSATGRDGKQQVVAGSVDEVSARLQAALGHVGVAVTATPQGEDMRLAGVTRSGKKFALVLKRQKTDNVERTAIAVEWEKEADEQFWFAVVDLLATTARN